LPKALKIYEKIFVKNWSAYNGIEVGLSLHTSNVIEWHNWAAPRSYVSVAA